MNLDELRSAQSRERQASQLQHLRDGFYEEAASFIRGLRTERERAAAQTDYSFPYDDPEVQRLTNEIQTAEEVVESLYERRVGKVVKMASFDAAGMAVDAEGLTAEESDLFETLVGDIEANRTRVLDALAGTAGDDAGDAAPGGADTPTAEPTGSDRATPADAGHETPAATDTGAGADPESDGPVHIGNGPAADGPVSTADEASPPPSAERAPPDADPAPTPDAAGGREAAADSTSTSDGVRQGSGGGDRGPMPDGHDDGMDAASAMGGESAGRSDEVPGGVPDPTGTDTPPSETASATSGADTTPSGVDAADGTAAGDAGRPASPPEEPPGHGNESAAGTASGTASTTGSDDGRPGTGTESGATPEPGTGEAAGRSTDPSPADHPASGSQPAPGRDGSGAGDDTTEAPAAPATDTGEATGTLVRVTADVGEIFGVDGRAYDLDTGDVVVLPPDNATPLVEDGSAEPLDSTPSFTDHSNRS